MTRDGRRTATRCDVLVVGGGASGLASAIAAARQGARVTVLEARDRVGRKLLRTGNGRCNLTNTAVDPQAYNDPDFVSPVLGRWPTARVLEFFEGLGLLVHADDRGRVFPRTDAASSVLDVLRLSCEQLGVQTLCGRQVVGVDVGGGQGRFVAHADGGETYVSPALVLATGDQSDLCSQLGHRRTKRRRVLCPLACERDALKGLEGVRVDARARLLRGDELVDEAAGEVLFKRDGVSGIPMLDFSRHVADGDVVLLDLFPDVELDELEALLARRGQKLAWRTPDTFLAGMLQSRVALAVRRQARLAHPAPDAPACFGDASPASLARAMKGYRLEVVGPGDPRSAQVTAGGLRTDEFDPDTLQSRRTSGLYATGEVLDVDGRCGGFNLHWAWASGLVAGSNAARVSVRG